MAAVSLYVSNPFRQSRELVDNIDLCGDVSTFKNTITKTVGIEPQKQELIYMGECLEDDGRSLQSYGVEKFVTVFVYEKPNNNGDDQDMDTQQDMNMSLEELQGILSKARNPLYIKSVKRLVKNTDSLKKAVKNIPAVKNDGKVAVLVEDPDLLLCIIETATAEKIIAQYPSLCYVMKHIMSNASLDSSSHPLFSNSNNNDDDEDGELMGIDPAFLAQAELMAANEQGQQGGASSGTAQTANQRNRISATDLANALSFATMTPGAATTSATTTPTNETDQQTEAALEQMRAMGIMDDDLSRRALTMSAGVVEAALNLIFEGALN